MDVEGVPPEKLENVIITKLAELSAEEQLKAATKKLEDDFLTNEEKKRVIASVTVEGKLDPQLPVAPLELEKHGIIVHIEDGRRKTEIYLQNDNEDEYLIITRIGVPADCVKLNKKEVIAMVNLLKGNL